MAELNQDPYALLTADDFAVILDSRCSITMTNDESDFIDGFVSINQRFGGIAAGLTAQGVGNVVLQSQGSQCQDSAVMFTCSRCSNTSSSSSAAS